MKQERRDGHQGQRSDQGAPHAQGLHQGGGERTDQAVEEDADGGGQGNRAAVPAELRLPRQQQHARRRAQARRHEQGDEGHAGHDQGVFGA
jgi:hypothetical protein